MMKVMEFTNSRLIFFTNISHELRTPLNPDSRSGGDAIARIHSIKGKARDTAEDGAA